ncbi:MAG: dTDP-4-dehydrorhamnose reductase [Desulfobacterales bacterium]|nr:MAG: dTDP-4-dehydrorhamnose reductase [Desulfobacterales bacterium]
MKILTYGASGQLGCELMRQGQALSLDMHGVAKPQTDITDVSQVESVFSSCHPDLAINAAAYTNVDGAESEPELAMAINKDGAANLARVCTANKIPLIHISTDYVFDGTKRSPYRETDPVSPLGVYGRSKAEGESAVRSILDEHIIVRTSWLYSSHGHNFVKTMLKLAREKEQIQVVSDQYGSPTSAADLAAAILSLAEMFRQRRAIAWGTYHYCGAGIVSWHGFARTIVEIGRQYVALKTTRIEPIKTADYPTQAARPAYSALDCSLIRKHFGISAKPWRDSLKTAILALLSPPERGVR